MRRTTGIATQVALVSLGVAAAAFIVLGIGVLVFGAAAFERLMLEHGETVAVARGMFMDTVAVSFAVAGVTAAAVATLLAVALSKRVTRRLDDIGRAARSLADGDHAVRVPRAGPEEISSLADSFNQMAERLEDQERVRREFVANAAHELRTPLTNLVGYLEALRDEVMAPNRETFESLREEAERLVRLSRSLDALADGDLVAAPVPVADLDRRAVIGAALELTQPALERRGIGVEVRLGERLYARASPDHIAQVLANLLQNAVRYTPLGGRVAVFAERRPNEVLVSVTNSGEGIPAVDLPRVFERFYRVEKSRDPERGGAGIGLAIVKQLIERAGGKVGAESADGSTRFWFSLPSSS